MAGYKQILGRVWLKIALLSAAMLLMTRPDAMGQQKPVFSQYMFNALAVNPAFAGSQDELSITAINRKQWVNFEGAPTIQTLSANTAIARKKIGVGFVLARDKVGVHSNTALYLTYAYRIRFARGALSMGLQAGFDFLKSDFTILDLNDINDPNFAGIFSKFNPNFGTGLFYVDDKFYAGLSVPYLINSKFFKQNEVFSDARAKRYYFLTAGRLFDLSETFEFKPSTLIRYQETAPVGIDVNLQLIMDRKISVGASYRSGDALISNFEIQLNPNFRIGYAYEWVLSGIGNFTRGTHEFMVNYRIKIPGLIAGVDCPTYF